MGHDSLSDRSRRESVEAFSIRLADGNFWGFALPRARIRPRVIRGVDDLGRLNESIEIVSEVGYPLAIRRLIQNLSDACEGVEPERQHESFFRLAAALIQRAHDVDLQEVSELLEIEVADLPSFIDSVLSVVTGECLETSQSLGKKEVDV